MAGVVYSIPCKDCPMVYIGETGRRYEVREKEHMKDAKQLEGVSFTRVKKGESQTEHHQSALTDHVAVCNNMINWEGVKLPAKDQDWTKRGIRERLFVSEKQGHTPSIVTRGATISRMCIPSCCCLPPPHLVVVIRSTEDEINLLVIDQL